MCNLLLLGIGNISRGDDGLGWLFAKEIEKDHALFIEVQKEFQLMIEHALQITDYDAVIIVDASENKFEHGFQFRKLPVPEASNTAFTSHVQTPENVLFLAAELYEHVPDVYVMEIHGEDWELGHGLSKSSTLYLQNALVFFKSLLTSWQPSLRTAITHPSPFAQRL
ncbi:MAG: hydrogenase maturation protease [Saprospiraceae bacterium]|nr:hydrogenase maturation protease [Saprospiraceae bacterium]